MRSIQTFAITLASDLQTKTTRLRKDAETGDLKRIAKRPSHCVPKLAMVAIQAVLFATALASPATFAGAKTSRVAMTPDEIKDAFVGKVLTDGHHWSALIQPDGGIKAIEMGRSKKGRWQLKGNEFCMALPKGSTLECWRVFRNKDAFVFNRFNQDQLDVRAEPLTTKFHFD